MAPGMSHSLGGPGPNSFDMLPELEKWAEQGRAPAPARVVATKFENDLFALQRIPTKVVRTRLLLGRSRPGTEVLDRRTMLSTSSALRRRRGPKERGELGPLLSRRRRWRVASGDPGSLFDSAGKVVFITGDGNGIGGAAAVGLAEAVASVAVMRHCDEQNRGTASLAHYRLFGLFNFDPLWPFDTERRT